MTTRHAGTRRRVRRLTTPFMAMALAIAAAGCDQPLAVKSSSGQTATIPLLANTVGTPIALLVATVTAPDIPTPLIFNLDVVNGVASGTLTLPTGSDRLVTLQAFDAKGIETHRGAKTVQVLEGTNPTVSITLAPLVGSVAIDAAFGTVIVSVSAPADTFHVGDVVPIGVTIIDSTGGAPVSPVWATTNPGLAMVDSTGLLTTLATGDVAVAVSYRSATASVLLHVVPAAPLRFASIYAGDYDTCGLTAAGEAWCWGRNTRGEIGVPPATQQCMAVDGTSTPCVTTPTRVAGIPPLTSMSLGFANTCGLAVDGSVWCWGENSAGQLGLGSADTSVHAPGSQVIGGNTFVAITSGQSNSCGIRNDGAVLCWGWNASNRLGSLTSEICVGFSSAPNSPCSTTPLLVPGGLTFQSIDSYGPHVCGVTTSGSAVCWGSNVYGQLGNGLAGGASTGPVAVQGGLAFTGVVTGATHSCGLATDAQVYCWGLNASGQFGNGQVVVNTTQRQTTPLPVGLPPLTAIVSGPDFECGLIAAGTAVCWGANYTGQLGNLSWGGLRDTPAPVEGNIAFASLSLGAGHSCGVDVDGFAWCWGRSREGQLALPSGGPVGRPIRISAAGGQP